MTRTAGLYVVNRLELMRLSVRSGRLADAAREQVPVKAFESYRGFDGIAWPKAEALPCALEGGLASASDRPAVEEYMVRLPDPSENELLFLSRGGTTPAPSGWSFAGFDVGFVESEWSHYSLILSEVVFGERLELTAFRQSLSDSLLFTSLSGARALVDAFTRLRRSGTALEEGEMEPWAVYLANEPPSTTGGC